MLSVTVVAGEASSSVLEGVSSGAVAVVVTGVSSAITLPVVDAASGVSAGVTSEASE